MKSIKIKQNNGNRIILLTDDFQSIDRFVEILKGDTTNGVEEVDRSGIPDLEKIAETYIKVLEESKPEE